MNTNKFISEYNYSIELPKTWSEYQLTDGEMGTNGFFDTSEWTGNLRITLVSLRQNLLSEFFEEKIITNHAKEINWNNIIGIFYAEQSKELYLYYWYLFERQKLYFCSFTIDLEMKDTEQNKAELKKIIKILKTIKTAD